MNTDLTTPSPQGAASTEPGTPTIAVLGLGYVGLPVATAFADAGFRVVGIDVDRCRLDEVAARVEPLSQPGAVNARQLTLTTSPGALAAAHVVFICVPTPLEHGEARHDAVRACASAFAQYGRADALVILESTVRPGFLDELRPILGHGGGVALAYAPERIDPQPGEDGRRLRDVPRLVAGMDDSAQTRAVAVLRAVGVPVHPVPRKVAEYAKLLENSYRLLNVAFIDEFAALCRADGVDPRAVVGAAATKPFGYQPFWPGVGAGGHCVAVDPAFLVHRGRELAAPLGLLESALTANAARPFTVAGTVAAGTAPGATVLVVGLTYKPGVPDTRESGALVAARALAGMNRRVIAHDPLVGVPPDLEGVGLTAGLESADAVVLLVRQPDALVARLLLSGLPMFDATGTLPGATEV
jgi:UDP-N-acetyl-D-glucosamine dehydrogenase